MKEKRSKEELFYDLVDAGYQVMALKGIVQNEGTPVSKEELLEWCELVDNSINKINSLKKDVVRHIK